MSVLSVFAPVLDTLAAESTPVLAVIVATVAVRLLISPLSYLRFRAERRRAALAPRIAGLREKHRDDPLALMTETFALQRAAGAGPLVSLLPGLAQAPFLLVMYHSLIAAGLVVGGGLLLHAGLVALAVVLGWWSARRMARSRGPAEDSPRWLALLPYLTVGVVVFLPPVAGLYVVTSTAWTVLEQAVWGPRPVPA